MQAQLTKELNRIVTISNNISRSESDEKQRKDKI